MTSTRKYGRLNETRNYVIDLKTLGLGPDAVVVAAALVQFDAKEVTLVGRWTLDTEEQGKRGRKIDTDTVMWWLRQSTDARNAIAGDDALDKRVSVSGFLIEVKNILSPRSGGGNTRDNNYTLWASPSHFDIAVLEHLARQFKPHWRGALSQRKMHNVRTALAMINLVRAGIDWPEDLDETPNPGDHDAAADAMVSAAVMRDALKEIEGFTGLLNVVRESLEKHAALPPVAPQGTTPRVLQSADDAPRGSLLQWGDDRAVLHFPDGQGWHLEGVAPSEDDVVWGWCFHGIGGRPVTLIAEGLTEAECRHLSGLSVADAIAWCSARAATQEAAK